MKLTIRRNLTSPESLQAGEYIALVEDKLSGAAVTVMLACPLCSEHHELTLTHKIPSNGHVVPAFKCPACPCIEWLILDGWAGVSR